MGLLYGQRCGGRRWIYSIVREGLGGGYAIFTLLHCGPCGKLFIKPMYGSRSIEDGAVSGVSGRPVRRWGSNGVPAFKAVPGQSRLQHKGGHLGVEILRSRVRGGKHGAVVVPLHSDGGVKVSAIGVPAVTVTSERCPQ